MKICFGAEWAALRSIVPSDLQKLQSAPVRDSRCHASPNCGDARVLASIDQTFLGDRRGTHLRLVAPRRSISRGWATYESVFLFVLMPLPNMSASVKESYTDVLIIGAGPAGVMCANALVRAGIGVRIVDKRYVFLSPSAALDTY